MSVLASVSEVSIRGLSVGRSVRRSTRHAVMKKREKCIFSTKLAQCNHAIKIQTIHEDESLALRTMFIYHRTKINAVTSPFDES